MFVIKKFFEFFVFIIGVVVFIPAVMIFLFDFSGNTSQKGADFEISVLNGNSSETYNLEEYLFGVVAAEMPASFHEEALKAQAVAARTYIINRKINKNGDHAEDVCTDSTHCKAYLSESEILKKHGEGWMNDNEEKIKNCIRETAGEIAVFSNEPIDAVFHSTGSGVTENAKDVWGGDVPYLVSVESPGDLKSPVYNSEVLVSFDEFKRKIEDETGTEISPYVGKILRNESGSVKQIDFGGVEFSGVKVREIFSLPSANFTVTAANNSFTFHCKGKGHGVGMSQYGAEYFAKQGMNYKDILKNYYKGIEIKNIGEIYDKNS